MPRPCAPPRAAPSPLLLLVIPYAINELLRVYAWLMLLDYQGVLNSLLAWLGMVDFRRRTWIPFLEYSGSVFVAMVYAYILFMVFPIYNTMETLDRNQIEAARDLGAATLRIHRRIVIPHAKPGIAVGCIMTFMLVGGLLRRARDHARRPRQPLVHRDHLQLVLRGRQLEPGRGLRLQRCCSACVGSSC